MSDRIELFRAGDRCEGFGFVLDGSVKVSVRAHPAGRWCCTGWDAGSPAR